MKTYSENEIMGINRDSKLNLNITPKDDIFVGTLSFISDIGISTDYLVYDDIKNI